MSSITPTALFGHAALQALNAVFSKEQAEVLLSLIDVPITTAEAVLTDHEFRLQALENPPAQ